MKNINIDIDNILLLVDSYKAGHDKCYNPKVDKVYSYLEARGGRFPKTVFFGLQYFLKKYLMGQVVTKEKIDQAEDFWAKHFGRTDYFDRKLWDNIVEKYNGYLPILIKAVPEGTLLPVKNVLITIENTGGKDTRWLVNFVETLLVEVWYPTVIATQSYYIKQDILGYLERTGNPTEINFKCHDFAFRGVTCPEQAGLGAAAHLVSFMGTDTVRGIQILQKYYDAEMCGYSIPATEHSVMCSFGRDGELLACENFLDKFPEGLIACVSDTYDIYNCCEHIWGGVLKDKVMARKGTLVVRPDSGDYLEIVPKVLDILWNKFGGTVNNKGFKVLDSHVRVIQGDGMNPFTINKLYDRLEALKWSADNLAVGSGGGLLMQVNRDTTETAFKASAVFIDGKWVDVWKDPVTGSGKKSKRGRLALAYCGNSFITVREEDCVFSDDVLHTVFENGKLLVDWTLDEVKANLAQSEAMVKEEVVI